MKTKKITTRDYLLTSEEIRAMLDEHLNEVNGRARTHTLRASSLIALAAHVERTLVNAGVTAKNRIGTRVSFRPAGPGSAYARRGYFVMTTAVGMRRVRDGWRLISADKVEIWATNAESLRIEISERAEADILRHSFDGLTVRRAA